jgi:sec-independent protein translocase protein TatB
MFDVGFSELLVIAIVALIVLGPERLPKAARFAGLWVRRARAHWYSVKAELERELAADELRRSLRETGDSLREAEHALRDSADVVQRELGSAADAAASPPRGGDAADPSPPSVNAPPDDARR